MQLELALDFGVGSLPGSRLLGTVQWHGPEGALLCAGVFGGTQMVISFRVPFPAVAVAGLQPVPSPVQGQTAPFAGFAERPGDGTGDGFSPLHLKCS